MSDINIPGIGSLEPRPALDHLDLLAPPVAAALTALAERGVATASSALVVAIDPELADTETMRSGSRRASCARRRTRT